MPGMPSLLIKTLSPAAACPPTEGGADYRDILPHSGGKVKDLPLEEVSGRVFYPPRFWFCGFVGAGLCPRPFSQKRWVSPKGQISGGQAGTEPRPRIFFLSRRRCPLHQILRQHIQTEMISFCEYTFLPCGVRRLPAPYIKTPIRTAHKRRCGRS